MHPLALLAGLGIGAYAWLSSGARLPPGQNPFDAFPAGVDGTARPLNVDTFTASSGRRYRVTSFAAATGTYHVAEKKGDVDWLGYFVLPSGERKLFAANADHEADIDGMLSDFSLSRGAL